MQICFLGDSFINGVGNPDCVGWVGRACAAARQQGYDLLPYNLGIPGETSTDLLERWREEIERRLTGDADGRLVFSFGVSDTVLEGDRPRVASDESLANTRRILNEARSRYPTLFVGPPPVATVGRNRPIARLGAALGALCDELAIPYLDTYTPLSSSPVWMSEVALGDGSHPGAGGYAILASLVQRWSDWRDWLATAHH